jgi:uncharacterized protein (TIGR02145 family)
MKYSSKRFYIHLSILVILGIMAQIMVSCSIDTNLPDNGSSNVDICGDREYDPTYYACVRGELVGFCRGKDYYPEYQQCVEGVIINNGSNSSSSEESSSSNMGDKCGDRTEVYNPDLYECRSGNKIYLKSSVSYGGEKYDAVLIGEQTWLNRNLNYNPSTGNSWCYNNISGNCTTYGRLYDWATAMKLPLKCNSYSSIYSTNNSYYDSDCEVKKPHHQGICPVGYHIPTNTDWDELYYFADSSNWNEDDLYYDFSGKLCNNNYINGYSECLYKSEIANRKLKTISGWNGDGNGDDTYGFSALPGGSGNYDFNFAGYRGYWWSTTEYIFRSAYADYRLMYPTRNSWYASWRDISKSEGFSLRCLKD